MANKWRPVQRDYFALTGLRFKEQQCVAKFMTSPADNYFERIYDELRVSASRRLEGESTDNSLDPSVLIHEVYLRVQSIGMIVDTNHFRALASQAMQRILVDRARSRGTLKRGGNLRRITLADLEDSWKEPAQALEISELLEQFERRSPRKAELVRLRIFGGLKLHEAAEVLGISPSTADDDWAFATAWLRREWCRDSSFGNL